MSDGRALSLSERLFSGSGNLLGRLGLGRTAAKLMLRVLTQREAPRLQRAFEGYEPRDGDVIVSTFPKSGTNWMLQMSYQIAWEGQGEFEHIYDVAPWPDRPLGQLGASLNQPIEQPSPTGVRVIKSHLAHDHIPYDEKARYIVVIRDPKDVFVSFYHFGLGILTSMVDVDFSLGEWLDMQRAGRMDIFGTWAEHTASWWTLRDKENVLILHYAEMRKDLPGTVAQVAEHLGVSLSEAAFAEVVERSSFPYMKRHDHRFQPQTAALRGERPAMVRSGVSGSAKQSLTEAQRALIDEDSRDGLKRLGSDFPFDEVYGASSAAA